MSFTSLSFILFFSVTLLVYYIFPQKYRYIAIAIFSTIFYYFLSGWLVILLLSIALLTYIGGLLSKKRKITAVMVILFVAILSVFKYAGFFEQTILDIVEMSGGAVRERVINLVLPVGISFYLFEAISYVIDCKNDKVEPEKNFLLLYTFLAFFATVTSGPIERAGRLIPQFKNPSRISYDEVRDSLMLMLWGFFLKLVLANRLSIFVNNVYDSPTNYAGTIVFIGTVFYTFEIYCDFAGYSCMAIGMAKLMGISVCDNFDSPYLSESIAEFWRRWHISLSTWLKDYLYIPLGGNRKGTRRKLLNLIIVFLVSGFWHGAAWTFVFWGLLHGLYQVVAILTKSVRDKLKKRLQLTRYESTYRAIKVIITFLLVNFAWIFFRADTFANAFEVVKMSIQVTPWVFTDNSLFGVGLSQPDIRVLIISLMILIITDICNRREIKVRSVILKKPLIIRWIICIGAILFIAVCGVWGPGYNAGNFIYMGF